MDYKNTFIQLLEGKAPTAKAEFKNMIKGDSMYRKLLKAYQKNEDDLFNLVEYIFDEYEDEVERIMADYSITEEEMTDIITGKS